VILFGREYWEHIIDLRAMADEGVIADADLDLCHFAETADEAWKLIRDFHAARRAASRGRPRPDGSRPPRARR
jgi:predicted Rossmann-fold nucleotide-binding protein